MCSGPHTHSLTQAHRGCGGLYLARVSLLHPLLSLTSLRSFVILGLVSQPVHSLFSSSFLASFPHSLHSNPHLSICPRSPHQSRLWSLCLPPHYDISSVENMRNSEGSSVPTGQSTTGFSQAGQALARNPFERSYSSPPQPRDLTFLSNHPPVSSSKLKHTVNLILCWVWGTW